jgi:peptide/nickel transport system substrate-binding protein
VSPNTSSRKKFKLGLTLVGFIAIFTMLLAACGGEPQSSSKKSTLIVAAASNDQLDAGFSPYNQHTNPGVLGLVYEPLYFANKNKNDYQGLLASSYAWSNGGTTLTFTLKDGIKWNDGQDFTSDDVVFTFNDLLKKYPDADTNSLWKLYLKDVSATDKSHVVVNFQKSFTPAFWQVAAATYIVPKHVFANIDPTKQAPTDPVGTGAYKLGTHSPDSSTYVKNDKYRDAANIAVDEIKFPVFKGNDAFKNQLLQGGVDWAGFFQADINETWVSKDPANNHIFMPPINMYGLFLNTEKAPFNDVNVRQAINAAISRDKIYTDALNKLTQPANVTGLLLPKDKDFLDPQYANLSNSANAAKVDEYLKAAGYAKGADGIYAKDGKPLSFSIKTVQGYTDWDKSVDIIKDDLAKVGISVTKDVVEENAYYDGRGTWDFDAEIGGVVGGPSPFYLINNHLNSAKIKAGNWSRWNDPDTDKLLEQYATSTDAAAQKTALLALEKIYVEKVPAIPLYAGADWAEYSSLKFTGWPSEQDPYASANPSTAPDLAIVVSHLKPKN